MTISPKSPGALLAVALSHCWRDQLPPLTLDREEFSSIVDLCLSSGTGGLVWRRIAGTTLAAAVGAERLHDMSRLLHLRDEIRGAATVQVVTALRSAGIEPIVLKGWSTARLYPDCALRPSGDIDLLVAPARQTGAKRILAKYDARLWVDFDHLDIGGHEEMTWRELESHSVSVGYRDVELRVLGREHQLRMICSHLLRHAAGESVRPLWLCDLAALLESLPPSFDWEYCLGPEARFRQWAMTLIQLARTMLGAEPAVAPALPLPAPVGWLERALVRQWNAACLTWPNSGGPLGRPWKQPARFVRGVLERWPDPLQATLQLGGDPNYGPRLPYQMAAFLFQAGTFVIHASRAGALRNERVEGRPIGSV